MSIFSEPEDRRTAQDSHVQRLMFVENILVVVDRLPHHPIMNMHSQFYPVLLHCNMTSFHHANHLCP